MLIKSVCCYKSTWKVLIILKWARKADKNKGMNLRDTKNLLKSNKVPRRDQQKTKEQPLDF